MPAKKRAWWLDVYMMVAVLLAAFVLDAFE